MKKLPAMIFLMCLAAASGARADSMVSGSVSSNIFGGSTCNQSAGPASSVSASCTDPSLLSAYSTLTGNVGASSGSVLVNMSSAANGQTPLSYETANFLVSLTGMYMLTGGTGFGNAGLDFNVFLHGAGGGGSFSQCDVVLDAQTQSCAFGGTLNFLVPYNTPLSLDVTMNYSGTGEFGDGAFSGVTYNFSALTPVSPVPEPASLVLIGMGLIPLIGRFRRRR